MSRMSTRQAPSNYHPSKETKTKPAWMYQRGADGFSGRSQGRWDGGQIQGLLHDVAASAGLIEGESIEDKKTSTTSRNTVITQGVKLADLAKIRQEHIAQSMDAASRGPSASIATPRAFEGYRKAPTMDAKARAQRGKLATRSFAHFLGSRDAEHLTGPRRQQLQRLFSGLMMAMADGSR